MRFHDTEYAVYDDATGGGPVADGFDDGGNDGDEGDVDDVIDPTWREAARPWWFAGSGRDGVRRPVSLPTRAGRDPVGWNSATDDPTRPPTSWSPDPVPPGARESPP